MLVGVVDVSGEWRAMTSPVDLSVVAFSCTRDDIGPSRPVIYPRECHVILNPQPLHLHFADSTTTMSTDEPTQAVAPAKSKPVKKLKPARKQVKAGDVEKKETVQTGKEYSGFQYTRVDAVSNKVQQTFGTTNGPVAIAKTTTQSECHRQGCHVWGSQCSSKVKSQTRCNIKSDSGLTRANQTGVKYCCLFYARGCCPYGWECNFLHVLPDPNNALPDSSKDCFARDKFADYRDDMGGVGSFNRQNRTLYVGRIKETGPGPETEEIVNRHFKEWGEIERSRSNFEAHWDGMLISNSSGIAISKRCLRDLCVRVQRPICQGSNGMPIP